MVSDDGKDERKIVESKAVDTPQKVVVGLIEKVKIVGESIVEADAIMDTGATTTSVDINIAKRAELGPILGTVKVKSKTASEGYTRRIKVKAIIEIMGKLIPVVVNIQDRQNMYTPILIGRDVLHSNFIVDVEKTHKSKKINDIKNRD
ncbi:MAG: RimK/LysX family protein [archaeon]